MTPTEAVREIAQTATTFHVKAAAERALTVGTSEAIAGALHTAKAYGQTLHVINVANKQLGFPSNDTSR